VNRQHQEARLNPELRTMRRPEDGRLYLISSVPAEKLSRRYRIWSIAQTAIVFGALAGHGNGNAGGGLSPT
jgi:hypothetical protein